MKVFIIILFFVSSFYFSFSQDWKQSKYDFSVNFYEVCRQAKLHFDTIDITKKGSGWKGYQRWKNENEYKYYPNGIRNNIDPYLAKKQSDKFIQNTAMESTIFTSGWEELGPSSKGQITGHPAFGMGRIVTFYVDPNNDKRLYFGTRTGGFWKSLDGGITWAGGSTDFLPASGVNSIAVSPTNPDSILININSGSNFTSHGVYRSTDGGNTWSQSNFNPVNLGWGGLGTNDVISKISYHPSIPNMIFIATSKGVYRSNDNLATWTVVQSNEFMRVVDFHPTNPSIVYTHGFSARDTIFVSTDSGLTFTPTTIPGAGFGKMVTSKICPNCLYFFTFSGLYKSINNGVTFTLISNPVSMGGVDYNGFSVSDLNDSIMLSGYLDAYVSTDGGLNFSQVTEWFLGDANGVGNGFEALYNTSTNYIHADLQEAACINGVFYAVTDGFMVKSVDNGITWEILSEDVGIRMNYTVGVSQSNHDRTICGSQDNGTSIHTENGWVEMAGGDGMACFIHPLNEDYMMNSIQWGSRGRTLDGGQSSSFMAYLPYTAEWIAPLFYDPNDQMSYYSMGDVVQRGEEFGNSLVNVGSPSFSRSIQYGTIAQNNSKLIIATDFENIELSNDGGSSWTNIKSNLPSYAITDVVFDPKNDSTIIVTYGRHHNDSAKVFITHNLGAIWQNISYNLSNMPVLSVIIDHTDASTIYLGTEIGLYKKAMSAGTWSLYNTNLPNTPIKELDIMYGSNTLRASTWGRGLWEYSLYGRENYPAITKTKITNPPTLANPIVNVDQYVTSTIIYDSTLSSVYLEWSNDTAVFGNVITMTNVSGNEWVSDTSLPNYSAGTKMFFKVFAVGNVGDTTETYKFMYSVRGDTSCIAQGLPVNNDSSIMYIANVTLGNLNNSSTNNLYTLYNNLIIDLYEGAAYTISDTVVSNGNMMHSAWIDFNNDTEFTPNEIIMFDIANISGSGTFTVPYGIAGPDSLRMRVRLSPSSGFLYYSQNDIPRPCGSYFGEVEDYWVQIHSAPPPPSLSFTYTKDSLCEGYSFSLSYTGDTLDSLSWNISNGTNTIISTNLIDTITLLSSGTYTISLVGYANSLQYTIDSINAIHVSSPSSMVDNQNACNSFTWIDGNTYTASNNTATNTLVNAVGCDSIVLLNLTITNSTFGIDNQSACDSFTWINGSTYTTSNNTATDTLLNTAGCDSIITLNLTIINSNMITDTQSACNSFTWIDGNTYTASNNTATDTLVNAAGCDSIVLLNLTITNSTFGMDNQSACDSFTWINGSTYTTSNNTATDTLLNTAGCDSIITLNLTITNSNMITDTQSACNSFTWIDGNTYTASNNTATDTLVNAAGCDSIVLLNLTITNSTFGIDNQSACESFTWINGSTYTASNNTATDTLTTSNGCDSIVMLNLTINSVVASVSKNSLVLTAMPSGALYQWIDCLNNDTAIAGEQSQSFVPSVNGSYAVVITKNGCSDTSVCIDVNTVGISENRINELIIFPNPSKGKFSIKFAQTTQISAVEIMDMNGKLVHSNYSLDKDITILNLDLMLLPGTYFVLIRNLGKTQILPIVIQ